MGLNYRTKPLVFHRQYNEYKEQDTDDYQSIADVLSKNRNSGDSCFRTTGTFSHNSPQSDIGDYKDNGDENDKIITDKGSKDGYTVS